MVADTIDGLDNGKPALSEPKDREGARFRFAAQDPLVDAMRKAGDLQLEVALVAPEPRSAS